MKQKGETKTVDTITSRRKKEFERVGFLDFKNNKRFSSPVLFSKGKITSAFFTEDSKLYLSPKQQRLIQGGAILTNGIKQWDCISNRIMMGYVAERGNQGGMLLAYLQKKRNALSLEVENASNIFLSQFSLVRLWNMSIVGAILLGMVTMTFLYRYLGQGVSAQENIALGNQNVRNERSIDPGMVFGTESPMYSEIQNDQVMDDSDDEEIIKDFAEMRDDMFKEKVKEMVKGYPIERMLPYILEKDRKVVAMMIGIAKKESAWGEHVPVLEGQDCFNYWGYRGQRKLMGTGGHTCFNSRKDAVDTVSKRIATLVHEKGKDTPEKMILWKCGSTCSGTPEEKKWVSDVNLYFKKLDS